MSQETSTLDRTAERTSESPQSVSETDLLLPTTPEPPPASALDRGRLIALAAMAALVAVGIALIVRPASKPGPGATTQGSASAEAPNAPAPAAMVKDAKSVEADGGTVRWTEPRPPVWRVASLREGPESANVEVVEGSFKKGFVQALTQAGVPRNEIQRVARAFDGIKRVEHPKETDSFIVAKERGKGTILAFEYAASPLDVWQARAEEASSATASELRKLVVRKLELAVERRRVASALVVSADLPKAIAAAGLRPEIVDAVDDALEGHIDPGSIRAGVRMRVVATEDWVDGTFVRLHVDALEFVPKTGTPLRIYFYERDAAVAGNARRAPAPGYYDGKGRQPYRGAFRSPLPLARVTSRFNPKRMHPVLKVVMPHNGVDYGASAGTPVYASASGTVVTAGNGGPCGNMVEIAHEGGVHTAYCHLSRFASGLHAGQKVEARQLVAYVGQTGRVTGPHLHFGVKRNGVFIDPLALKLDGVRVLPPSDREPFAKKRSELDSIIDGIALPSAADVPDEPDDKDLHSGEAAPHSD